MSLVGRNKELHRLNSLYASRQDVLMLLTGRKAVGKTTLLHAFAEDVNPLFFSCENVSDSLNRKAFENQLIQYSKDEDIVKSRYFPTWKEMLTAFADFPEKKRKVLILDNFDLLLQGNQDILTCLKNCWNSTLRPRGVMVIFAFHDGQMLMHLRNKEKSFLSAVTHHMRIMPITFMEMMREYPHYDFNHLIMLYSITGGVPRYFNYFQTCQDKSEFFTAVDHFIMNPFGDLFLEPVNLLGHEIDNVSGYHSVFLAMASGRKTLPDISGFCGLKESRVEEILDHLIAFNYVVRRVSITEKKIGRKTIRYDFNDPFFAFWYTFIFPYSEAIKNGDDSAAAAYLKAHFNDYVRRWFRQAAIAMFKSAGRSGSILLQCPQIGIFYNKDTEIDVVGIDPDKKELFLGECCYEDGTYDQARFEAFKAKCEKIREFRQFRDYEKTYGVFSNTPFEKNLIDHAVVNKNVLLFNGITIYSLNS